MTETLTGQWGPILVGVLCAVSIAIGARIALDHDSKGLHSGTVANVFAFGVGAFVSAVCLDFLPDAWSATGGDTAWWLLLGAFLLWLVTALSDSWFQENSGVGVTGTDNTRGLALEPIPALILAATLSFHTFLEGSAVAVAFHTVTWSTLAFAIAVILHKLPEGVLWGFALYRLFPKDATRIRLVLLVPACFTFVGTVLGVLFADFASTSVLGFIESGLAGAMLYIAFAELLPTLRENVHQKAQSVCFVAGVALMCALTWISSLTGPS